VILEDTVGETHPRPNIPNIPNNETNPDVLAELDRRAS
jgi:hypothetical protein